jgi:hypothetical protein
MTTSFLFLLKSEQVKIAGNRINLNEIELVLKSHCNCRQPVALMINSRIIVFLQDNEKPIHLDRISLATYLPNYAIPSSFITLAHFPLLVSGKIDRHELMRSASDSLSEQPQKEVYSTTIAAFSRALEDIGIQRSQIDRDFFAAGGSSLNALLVIAKLHAAGFHCLTVERLISAPTLRDIELDLSTSNNETDRYFAEEIDDTHSFRFIPLDQVDKQIALKILTESFVTHGEIDTLIHKHRAELKVEFMREWGDLMDHNWSTYLASGVSFGVIDENSRLIGLSLSYDMNTPPLAQSASKETTLLTPLCVLIDNPLHDRIDQLRTREHLSRIMRSHVTTVDPSLCPAKRLTTMYFIEKHLLDVAKENGYHAVITANTSSVTQQLAEHVLKYDTNDMTRVCDCYEPCTEKPIFPDAPNHYTVVISVKYIGLNT